MYIDSNEMEQLAGINDGLRKELEVIVQTIESQYNRKLLTTPKITMIGHRASTYSKDGSRIGADGSKLQEEDAEVRSKETKLKHAQGKVNKMKKEVLLTHIII